MIVFEVICLKSLHPCVNIFFWDWTLAIEGH